MFPAERTMALWHGVVVRFDGTDRARCAVRWAAGEAAARHCPLHVVRVVVHHTPTMVAGWVPALTGPDECERDLIEDQLVAEVDACRAAHPGLEVHATCPGWCSVRPEPSWCVRTGYAPVAVLCSQLDVMRWHYPRVPTQVETVMMDSTDEILDHSTDARLVVAGDRRHGVVHRLLAGSVGHRVLHHARCSVAVVP